MHDYDAALFALLTAGPDAAGWLVLLARGLATAIVPLVLLGLVVTWLRGTVRFSLLDAVAAGLLGLGIVQVFGALAYRPRPFEIGLGQNLLQHMPENSFPSDHATLMFAIAASLLMSPLRRSGWVVAVLSLGVGWARVFLGAHYPGDILGGAVLGVLCALIVKQVDSRRPLWGWTEQLYRGLTARLF